MLLLFLATTARTHLYAQVPTEDWELQIETLAEANEAGEVDLIQLAESMERLRANPLPINFVEAEALSEIPYFNIFQINNLLQYRSEVGIIYSYYELYAIKGFSDELVEQVRPFLDFSSQPVLPRLEPKKIWRYSRHNLLARSIFDLQKREGFRRSPQEGGFLGRRPQGHYLRYRSNYRDLLSLGLTLQQDPGEPWGGAASPYGFDYLSGHLALENYGPLQSLILGDFHAEYGQGLALWTGLAFGKGAQSLNVKRYGRGLRPYTGADENRFLRGVAASYQLQSWQLDLFYSNNRQDGNLQLADTSMNGLAVSSLQQSGLHRTANEIANKNSNRLQTKGAHLKYRRDRLKLGFTAVDYRLNLPLQPPDQLFRLHNFQGRSLQNYSFNFNYLYLDLNFFGEAALSHNGAWALVGGVQTHPAEGLYLNLLYRNIHPRYQSLYIAPFAEAGQAGERGTYLGLEWDFHPMLSLRSFFDFYRFRWLRFGVDGPSQGREWLSQLDARLSRYHQVYLRLRYKTRGVNPRSGSSEATLPLLETQLRRSARLHSSYRATRRWTLAHRAELMQFHQAENRQWGALLFQDLRYHREEQDLKLTARLALINTPGFDSRIYAYEHDLTYAFSIPPYYGRALRFYGLAQWDPLSRLTLQAKYGITVFSDRDEISSGINRIEGSLQSQWRLQLRWRW